MDWHPLPLSICSASCVAADIISTVEFNSTGELLATGDKGGRVVVFQREQEVRNANNSILKICQSFFWKHLKEHLGQNIMDEWALLEKEKSLNIQLEITNRISCKK